MHRAQIHGRNGLAIFVGSTGFGIYREHKDFTEAGGNRPHFGFQSTRQFGAGGRQALINQLAGKIDIGVITENSDHLRQAVTGDRTGMR